MIASRRGRKRKHHRGHHNPVVIVVAKSLMIWNLSSLVPPPHASFETVDRWNEGATLDVASFFACADSTVPHGGGVVGDADGPEEDAASRDSVGTAGTCDREDRLSTRGRPDGGSDDEDDDDHPCSLFLAESSIPNAGLGMYTAVDIGEGETIGVGDLLIPITNRDRERNEWWLLDDAVWNAEAFDDDVLYPESLAKTVGFVPGIGTAVNCHPGLVNAQLSPRPSVDSARLHRDRNAGAGAFSMYHSVSALASRDVVAGEEIFLDYGTNWFLRREDRLGGGVTIPFAADYERADSIVREMHSSLLNNSKVENVTTYELERRRRMMWDAIRTNADDDRLRAALPTDVTDLGRVLEVGGTARYSLPNSIRSPRWLTENGYCVDNLRAGTSTIPGAGRGAFVSRRRAKRGSVVSPVPVMQLRRESMVMFDATRDERTGRITHASDDDDAVMGYQLMLNYCYGHPSSSVLLLPYSPIVNLVNHGGKDGANVELRWSKSTLSRSEWLSLPPEDLFERGFGLMMELVAIRDIMPGEEVLLDYGRMWTEAWTDHVRNFFERRSPPPPPRHDEDDARGHHLSAENLTRTLSEEPLRTVNEQTIDPYPKNVHTACRYSPRRGMDDAVIDGRTVEGTWTAWHEGKCLRPCKILARRRSRHRPSEDDDGTTAAAGTGSTYYYYSAEMMNGAQLRRGCAIPRDERHVVNDIPRNKIFFMDVSYSRDHYRRGAFRHEIVVPEDVFPDAWKDL